MTRFNQGGRVDDDPIESLSSLFPNVGKPIGGSSYFTLTPTEWKQAHRHVLINCEEVNKFIEEFRTITKKKLRGRTRLSSEIEKEIHRGFVDWFMRYLPHHSSHASPNDESLPYDDLQDLDRQTLVSEQGLSYSREKQQYWKVQVRNSEGEIIERPMKAR
ncbi:hypothetical protein VNO78_03767 [Psophocarpus tetragonolobus]|uniref:Uncharacterized protein n=1 Tax=Psophocarpus tetragonolobus TaxID=3891 RepID=A0AAN9T3N6_PSOTE